MKKLKLLLVLTLVATTIISKAQVYQVPWYVQNIDPDKVTVYSNDLGGGYQQVTDSTAKADLSPDKRQVGMMVSYFYKGEWITQRYDGPDVLNVNWVNPIFWKKILTEGVSSIIIDTINVKAIILNDSIVTQIQSGDTLETSESVNKKFIQNLLNYVSRNELTDTLQRYADTNYVLQNGSKWTDVQNGISYNNNVEIGDSLKLHGGNLILNDTKLLYQDDLKANTNIKDTIELAENLTNADVYADYKNSYLNNTGGYTVSGIDYFPYSYLSNATTDMANYYGAYHSSNTGQSNITGVYNGFTNFAKHTLTVNDSVTVNKYVGLFNGSRAIQGPGRVYIPEYISIENEFVISAGSPLGKLYSDNLYGYKQTVTRNASVTHKIDTAYGHYISGSLDISDNQYGYYEKFGKNYFTHKIETPDTVQASVVNIINEGLIRDTTFLDFVKEHGGGSITFGSNDEIPFMNAAGNDFEYNSNFTFANNKNLNVKYGAGNTLIGDSAGIDMTTLGTDNTVLGYRAGNYLNSGDYNVYLGSRAGQNGVSNSKSVIIGAYSGQSNTGSNVVLVGYNTGLNNTTSNLVSVGYQAGSNNTSGSSNTFIGYEAGVNNTTGGSSTFIGYRAGYSSLGAVNNTFVGRQSGFNTTGGSENLFLGNLAGYSNVSGQENTYIGYRTGYLSTGSRNICIGSNAGGSFSGNDKLYIDNSNTSIPLIWGDFSTNELKIHGNLSHPTLTPSGVDATPDVSSSNVILWQDDGTGLTITNLDNAKIGATYTIINNSPTYQLIINDSGNFNLAGNWTGGTDDVLVVICTATNTFVEVSRSDN